MREIHVNDIINTVEKLCIKACITYPEDVVKSLNAALTAERSPNGKSALKLAIDNAKIAQEKNLPLCQDTGMCVVFAQIGQDVHIVGGLLEDAINEGVRRGYKHMRKSILDPLCRQNTKDNTPCVLHVQLVAGDKIKLEVVPKGFGSENMSRLKMLKPSDGFDGIVDFVVETVSEAGGCPCPPIVVGVGIGGTMEKCALLAKQALLRPLGTKAENPQVQALEERLLERINALGIGPQGLGGTVTALAVHINTYPTHIAGLPVAVNIQCHCARHAKSVL